MKEIVLLHHTGLGDHFICNGLVHSLLANFDIINLVCKKRYFTTLSHLYEDYASIKLLPVSNEWQNEMQEAVSFALKNNIDLYRVGFEKCNNDNFEKSFYLQYNLDPNLQYENFKFPKRMDGSEKLYNKITDKLGKDYIFALKNSSDLEFNYSIESNLPIFVPSIEDTQDVLDYIKLISNAKEIHFLNSAIGHLILQLYHKQMLSTEKIFYHHVRKKEHGAMPINIFSEINTINYE